MCMPARSGHVIGEDHNQEDHERNMRAIVYTGDALIVASWPKLGAARCETSVARFEALQGVVRAVRNARAEYNVEVGAKLQYTVALTHAATALAAALSGCGGIELSLSMLLYVDLPFHDAICRCPRRLGQPLWCLTQLSGRRLRRSCRWVCVVLHGM